MNEQPIKQSLRRAGVLLHITSLPSIFGIGDMGPEAFQFADRLKEARQHIWQVLPINPVHQETFSPYSALGSMAGNKLLISPELLAQASLLTEEQLKDYELPVKEKVDFDAALKAKEALLSLAWNAFMRQPDHEWQPDFKLFCAREAYWLEDYAAHEVLSLENEHRPWQQWESAWRDKHYDFNADQSGRQRQVMWEQYVFDIQWKSLRQYCNEQGIQLFGDLPFYVHSASADIWANRDLFNVDAKGNMLGVAGVPPDYFNSKGQLWNMPVYNWEQLKTTSFDWWVQRIRRNMEWFDLVRLDHFRAFSAYWEVKAGEPDATAGEWKPGPGTDLFEALKAALPALPFVAEDLGEIDAPVYELRDRYRLPGMRVLQFGFGEDMPITPHIAHNFDPHVFAFTGTHDNNTTRGWFKEEADKRTRKNLMRYVGSHVSARQAPDVLSRMAYASVANTVILPMQDILALPAGMRMNTPSQTDGNWQWRMLPGQFADTYVGRLRNWAKCYGRAAAK